MQNDVCLNAAGEYNGPGNSDCPRKARTMKKRFVIGILCCALALMLGLTACGGSGGSSSGGSGAGGKAEILPEYLDEDGGITINALRGLTGPEVVELLKQQGYTWTGIQWENADNGDVLYVRGVDGKTLKEDGYAAAKGKGDLAKGYVQIMTSAREIVMTPDDLVAVRDAMVQGFTVEDEWLVGFGAYLYGVMVDDAGERYILTVIAYDEHTAEVDFSTDAYLQAKDEGGVQGVIDLWKS